MVTIKNFHYTFSGNCMEGIKNIAPWLYDDLQEHYLTSSSVIVMYHDIYHNIHPMECFTSHCGSIGEYVLRFEKTKDVVILVKNTEKSFKFVIVENYDEEKHDQYMEEYFGLKEKTNKVTLDYEQ